MDEFPRSPPPTLPGRSDIKSQPESKPPAEAAPPPDLEIRVTVEIRGGETFLTYFLHSSSTHSGSGFHHRKIRGKSIKVRPQDYQSALLQEIERLHAGKLTDGSLALAEEIPADLAALGHKLYRELFPPEMRAAYRAFRKTVTTLLITSDEPWIPWELIKPYDDGEPEIIDDDFLCVRFQLTRWLSGGLAPAAVIGVERVTCIEAGRAVKGSRLPNADSELQWFHDLACRHPGIDDRSLPRASYPQLKKRLEAGDADLLHFVGHGSFESGDPDQSRFYLEDGRPFRPLDLHGEIQTRTKDRRPLVFLNACQVGRQNFSLTGLGGWAPRWVTDCGCGAFIAPLWPVNDRLAHAFAIAFYSALEDGRTFGRAARNARWQVRQLDPSKPTWLAFTVYAHPNGRLVLGRRPTPEFITTKATAVDDRADAVSLDRLGVDHAGDRGFRGIPGRPSKRRIRRLLGSLLAAMVISWAPKLYQPDLGPMNLYHKFEDESVTSIPLADNHVKSISVARGRVRVNIHVDSTTPLSQGALEKELLRSIENRLGAGWDPALLPNLSCLVVLDFGAPTVSKRGEMTACELEVGYRLLINGKTLQEDHLYEITSGFTERVACASAVRDIANRVGDRVREMC